MARKNKFDDLPDDLDLLNGATTTLARPANTEIILDEPLNFDYEKVDERVREEVRYKAIRIKQASKRMMDDIHNIGQALIDLKDLIPHGQFEELCYTEFGLSRKMASNWMNVARRIKEESVHLFSDTGALYMISAKSVSDETREHLITQAEESGQRINRKIAQSAIDEQRARAAANGDNDPATGGIPASGGNARTTTTREYTYLPGQGAVTHIVTTVDAGTGEVEQTDPLEGHIAVLKAAIDTAMWFSKQYNDQFNADRVVAGANSMIRRLEADS